MTDNVGADIQAGGDMHDLASRFREAAAARNLGAMAQIYADDATIWHNTDGIDLSVGRHLETFARNTVSIRDLRYEEVTVHPFAGGFVQRHRTRGTVDTGKELDVFTCIVCLVENGRIARLDEYWDSAALKKAGVMPSH